MIKQLLANWKTTYVGIAMIIGGCVHLGYAIKARGLTEADCTTTILSIITGLGFVAAGDAGAPPPAGSYTDTALTKKNTAPK